MKFLRNALRLIGACFLTSVFIVLVMFTHIHFAGHAYDNGYEDGYQNGAVEGFDYGIKQCMRPGDYILPDGDIQDTANANPAAGHRNKPKQSIHIQSL